MEHSSDAIVHPANPAEAKSPHITRVTNMTLHPEKENAEAQSQ